MQGNAIRLASISVRNLKGMPDLDLTLHPMTALIGPRGVGKSSVLSAIDWLVSGPTPDTDWLAGATVSAEINDGSGTRRLTRGPDDAPNGTVPAPKTTFLTARSRLPTPAEAPVGMRSDAAAAEEMVAMIAERRLGGAEGELLLIEEPELMLTPQQQRHLYHLLRRYSEKNQVIYSTRAPALLDATFFHEIVRLDRTSAGTRVRRAPPDVLNDYQRLRIEAEFDHERTEMFFASAVLLVEGQTERLSMPLMFQRLGHDPDALGISIVEVGGKGNLALVARVLWEMSIPHVIVFDADRGRQSAMDNAEIRRGAGGAPVFELRPDFEGAAGIHSYEDKVFDAWRKFSRIDPDDIPDIFKRIVETTVSLAEGSPG